MDRGLIVYQGVKILMVFGCLMTVFCRPAMAQEQLIDPTRPGTYRAPAQTALGTKAAPRWVLSSTLIAPARRLATINGKTVSIGARVAGAKVIAIESTHVALKEADKEIIIKLIPNQFKRMH